MSEDESAYPIEQGKLFRYLTIIDDICQLCGWGEIVITDYLRNSPSSLHHVGLGADIRVKDKPTIMYLTLYTICKAIEATDKRLRANFHWDIFKKQNQHIHVEIRHRNI